MNAFRVIDVLLLFESDRAGSRATGSNYRTEILKRKFKIETGDGFARSVDAVQKLSSGDDFSIFRETGFKQWPRFAVE